MAVIFCSILPHPPIAIPEIGGGEVEKIAKTKAAFGEVARRIVALRPDSIVIISPHGPLFEDAIVLNDNEELEGDFGRFGANKVNLSYPNNRGIVEEIEKESRYKGITAFRLTKKLGHEYGVSTKLDHGVLVPLYYLEKAGYTGSLVSVSMGLLSYPKLYSFGTALQKAVERRGERVVVIASADLSHRLTEDAPAGFCEEGKIFDEALVESLDKIDPLGVLSLDKALIEKAGECGLRPIIMMLGSLEGYSVEREILSYEGPFGVGYLVAAFTPNAKSEDRLYYTRIENANRRQIQEARAKESAFVALVRKTLEEYVREGQKLKLEEPVEELFREKRGTFVSIKKDGQLRGCIGTIFPTTDNLAQEIIANAIKAGTEDPRFFPVEADELEELIYSVDVLMEPETIDSVEQLDVKKYGVIVSDLKGRRRGLLLPNLEGIDSVEEQVDIARQKAGIDPAEEVKLERFEVQRYY